jgi:7-carboxy-7-deazaguanine synthase
MINNLQNSSKSSLNIKEIFYSLQGEALEVGLPTVFIRLVGCPLRCVYCDSEYAFYGNNVMQIADIIKEVQKYNTKNICITGGEPLVQKDVFTLIDNLVDLDYKISIETSGSVDIAGVNKKTSIVMDIKTPASNECDKNLLTNIPLLQEKDQLKFVICNKNDFDWSKDFIKNHKTKANILFSPVAELSPTHLADWILENQLNVRMQLQLHKILWGDKPGK